MPPDETGEQGTPRQESAAVLGSMIGVTLLWLLLARYLLPLAAKLSPMSLQQAISWSTFRALSQAATALVGLGLWALLVRPGLRRLLGHPPTPRALGAVAMASPLVWVSAVGLALTVAMPTLMEELRTRGPGASRQNAGAFAAELTGSSLLAILVTGVVLAPITEELIFRGALWSAVNALFGRARDGQIVVAELGPTSGQRLLAWLARGWGGTAVAAVVFAWMHADVPGGVGIVRVVSTLCLGLAAGTVRTLSGSLGAAILLHMLHNTLSLGQSRGWFAGLGPNVMGVPAVLLAAAVAGGVGLALLWRVGRSRLADNPTAT